MSGQVSALPIGRRVSLEDRYVLAEGEVFLTGVQACVRVLCDAGVLSVRRGSGGGIFVASDYVPIELLRSRSDVRLDEVAGVLEARRLLEPRVAQLAALHAGEEDFAHLERIVAAQIALEAQGDVLAHEDRFLQLDTQFHLRIARASGNATIVSLMRMLLRRLEIARDVALRQPPVVPWTIDVHQRTLAAIRSADNERIEAVMDEHLAAMEIAFEAARGRALVRPIPEFLRPLAERYLRNTL